MGSLQNCNFVLELAAGGCDIPQLARPSKSLLEHMVRSGDALLALRANWQAQMRRGHNMRRDIELPSYEGNPE